MRWRKSKEGKGGGWGKKRRQGHHFCREFRVFGNEKPRMEEAGDLVGNSDQKKCSFGNMGFACLS